MKGILGMTVLCILSFFVLLFTPLSAIGMSDDLSTTASSLFSQLSLDEGNSLNGELSSSPSPLVALFDKSKYNGLLVEYDMTDLLECTNLPNNVLQKVSSIATNGNCIGIFEYKKCQGQMLHLGGSDDGLDHSDLEKYDFDDKASSIIACDGMVQLHGRAIKIKIVTDLRNLFNDNTLEKLEIAEAYQIANNGNTSITKTYEQKKNYKETFLFQKIETLKKMKSFSISAGIRVESSTTIPFLENLDIKVELNASFGFTSQEEYQKRKEHTTENSREFSVKDEFLVSPCSIYDIRSFMLVKEDMPVEYEIEAEVFGGIMGSGNIARVELRKRLPPGMEYLKDLNNEGILVRINGSILSDLGVRAEVQTMQSTIPDCEVQGSALIYGLSIAQGITILGLVVCLITKYLKYRKNRMYSQINSD